jgi:arsenite methyltransferase
MKVDKEKFKQNIQNNYGNIALQGAQNCGACCSIRVQENVDLPTINQVAANLGYTMDDAKGMPENANLGLGCGNPIAIAALKEGETVLDLGSGGGFDCFLASKRVGKTGHVIGVDMTPEMIQLATQNAERSGYKNVEFRLGEIENLPIEDATIDVIISNCVINLSLDKEKVFREAYRVLNHGGRLSISDIMLIASLPEAYKNDPSMISSCVANAEQSTIIFNLLKTIGFSNIQIKQKDNSREILKNWIPNTNIEDYVASFIVEAQKL